MREAWQQAAVTSERSDLIFLLTLLTKSGMLKLCCIKKVTQNAIHRMRFAKSRTTLQLKKKKQLWATPVKRTKMF